MNSTSSKLALPLLHIDDSEDDRLLVQQAIRRTNSSFTLYSADGANSATPFFEFRKANGEDNEHPRPAIIVLDYDLGVHTGADFLIWLRVVRQITAIPVVMYSGSAGTEHIDECFAAGANHFVRKALRLEGLWNIISALDLCMSFDPPRFGPLSRLPEYRPGPGPRISRAAPEVTA